MRNKEKTFDKHKNDALELIKKFNKSSAKYKFILHEDDEIFGNVSIRGKKDNDLYCEFHLSEFWDYTKESVMSYMHSECISSDDLINHSQQIVINEYREIYDDMVRIFREDGLSCILD